MILSFSIISLTSYTVFFFQAEDGIRDGHVTGVQTCALPICEMLTGSRDGEEYRPEKLPHITVCSVGYPERLIGTLAARAYCRRRNPAHRLRSNTTPGEWKRPVPGTRWCLTSRPQLARLCLDQ